MMQKHQLQQPKASVIPDSLFTILKSCQGSNGHRRFPETEIFNEGWMLRLVLDALKNLGKVGSIPLNFTDQESQWFSEARLPSPFLRKPKKDLVNGEKDTLGEGYTCADGVIGHFAMRSDTKAAIKLAEQPRQFLVVEAKLNSRLSPGIKNALNYNQAARNIACMAEMMRVRDISVREFDSVGFFLVAPEEKMPLLATYLDKSSIKEAIESRIAGYEKNLRNNVNLSTWKKSFDALLSQMTIQPISWEHLIDLIAKTHPATGTILNDFYQSCRIHAGLKRQS